MREVGGGGRVRAEPAVDGEELPGRLQAVPQRVRQQAQPPAVPALGRNRRVQEEPSLDAGPLRPLL